ncbi:MAG: hypothetical protein WAN66_09185 [Limnoraphis robusta]
MLKLPTELFLVVKLQSSYVDELRVDPSRKSHLQQQNLKTNGQADRGDEKFKMIARVRYQEKQV